MNAPVTTTVFAGDIVQEPIKSMKELQERPWIIKLLAKVSLIEEGTAADVEGLKVIRIDPCSPNAIGVNL